MIWTKQCWLCLVFAFLPCAGVKAQSFREQAKRAASRGDNATAVELYEKAVVSGKKVFKPDEIEMTIRRAELGEAYRAVGRWDDAVTQLDYAWQRSRYDAEILGGWSGREGAMAMNCAQQLARAYQGSGKYREAVKTLREALADHAKAGRPEGEMLQLRALLTDTLLLLRWEPEAVEAAKSVMEGAERMEATHPTDAARMSAVMGEIFARHGHVDQARMLLQRAVRLVAQHLPPGHEDRVRIQRQLGEVLLLDGQVDEAERLLDATIQESANKKKEDLPELIGLRLAMAEVLLQKDRPNDVLEQVKEAKRLCERYVVAEHPDAARCVLFSGLAHAKLGQRVRGRVELEEAHRVLELTLGVDHPDTRRAKAALAELSK